MQLNSDIIFNKLILFTAQIYLQHDIDDGYNTSKRDHKIVAGIENYRRMGRFSKEEHSIIKEIGKHEFMEKLKGQTVSRTTVALELLKMWVETTDRNTRKHIHLGVSNAQLKIGAGAFVTDLIELKYRNLEKYTKTKATVNDSKVNAKLYFSYTQEHIIKGVKEWNLKNSKQK